MGNKCVCVNHESENEIFTSHVVPNGDYVSRDEKMEMTKSAPKSKEKNPLQALKDKIESETNKTITVSEISQDEFNKIIESFPNVNSILQIKSTELSELEKESENNSSLSKTNPVHFANTETDEEEYFEGYVNDKGEIEGFGTLVTQTGNFYKGNFSNGKFNGKGLFINTNGDHYYGDWVEGESKGQGELIMKSGSKYEGDFDNNMKNGKGKETYVDGSIFEGDFVNNERTNGVVTFKDGSTYKGELKRGKITGRGEYTWPDGRKYIGDILNGALNGNGKTTMADGSTFEGAYHDNKKQGNGTYTWPDGNKYTGVWRNNEPLGNGVLEVGGKMYDVTFRFGKIISSALKK